jgi:hypothetical protein
METFVIFMFWLQVLSIVSNAFLFYVNKDMTNSFAVVVSTGIAVWAASVLGWL